uniref:EF-hand domain-containing protein n=1 Tax=Anopheles christyi TaxID=43041 RepID=A0A182K1V3_9DIPT
MGSNKMASNNKNIKFAFHHHHTHRCTAQDCPNGKLTPAKFVDMYKMFFPSGNAEEFCDHVFRTFDMDKNGYIDFKKKVKV